jgi:hypothetical protein
MSGPLYWTMFGTTLPKGKRIHYQVLRIAVPQRGRALPPLQLAYNRDALPSGHSQNHLALSWQLPPHLARSSRPRDPDEPWYLATSLETAHQAAAWYQQRWWIEASFKDSKGHFRLKYLQVGTPERLSRLLMALTITLCWLAFLALAQPGALAHAPLMAVAQWGASVLSSLLWNISLRFKTGLHAVFPHDGRKVGMRQARNTS